MRGWLTAAFILGESVALGAQQPTFRSGTQTVPLYITVTDPAGRLVPNLTKDDFTVLDNGIPQTALMRQLPRLTRLGIVGNMAARTAEVAAIPSDLNYADWQREFLSLTTNEE